jgi:periplasmic divalent cation tolerance protein
MDIRFIYMTAGSADEARAIGADLVQRRLAACVNILEPMQSLYVWEGALQEAREAVLIAKTTAARVPEVIDRVKALHSYECPCVVSLPVEAGHHPFLEWVAAGVAPD